MREPAGGPRIQQMILARGRIWLALGMLCFGGSWLWAQPVVPVAVGGQAKASVRQPVYIEDSLVAQDLADEALELRDQNRFADAAQKLRRVVDEYPFKLMPTDEGSYTDAVLWVRAELQADDRLLNAYRSLYGPTAEREVALAMPTTTKPIDTQALHRVLMRYALTEAGLDAALALGAYHLERAEGGDASAVLDGLQGHPDLPAHGGRYHFQRALAALLLSDTAEYEAHRQSLHELDDESSLSELDALANRTLPPLRFQHDPAGRLPIGSRLPASLDSPLWEVKFDQSLAGVATNRPNLRGVPQGQSPLRFVPSGDATRVYLNLGDKVTAYDRASGWRLWEVTDVPASRTDRVALATSWARLTGPRGVLAVGGRAFAVLGWSNPRQNRPAQATAGVSLVGINATDGRDIWRIRPEELDQSLQRASFDGTPIGGDGRIYTLVKRVQVSGLHDLYLTAVNETDGSLIWRRHISSSSTQGNYITGSSARMVLHAGLVYVSDNRGAVCALDGRTGTMRWLTLLPDAGIINSVARRAMLPFKDLPAPVLVQAGLLVPPVIGSNKHILLDVNTGRVLRELIGGDWQNVQVCYSAGGNVLGVGQGVTCFDGRTLQPRWHTPLEPGKFGTLLGRPGIDLNMTAASLADPTSKGQALQIVHDADPSARGLIVLNTQHRLVAMTLNDGQIVADQPLTSPGNVMLTPSQVVIASADSLYGFTDWLFAHDQLTSRATQDPSNPQPGLSLARLALRTGHEPAVLEGVDLALSSLSESLDDPNEGDARQHRVFGLLREINDPSSGASVQLRGELLNRMATTATTPGQEVAYQLTKGLYLQERGDPERAAEHYQAVLADRSLAVELYTVGRGSIRAGVEAHRLLKALIQTHGREVYTPYDLLAEHELIELQAHGVREAQRYTDLADRYPLALCANQARTFAADLYEQAGQGMAALRQLQVVYLNTASIDGLSQVAGRIAQMYLQQDHPALTRRWLRRVNREHSGLVLLRDDQPVSIPSWLSELETLLATSRALPRINTPLSPPRLIAGRPVIPPRAGGPPPRDRVLMRDGQALWMLSSPRFDEVWKKPLPAPDMRVLAMDDRQILWWSQQTGQLGAMDRMTGEPLWPQIDFSHALDKAGDSTPNQQQRTREQLQFIQLLGGAGIRNPRARQTTVTATTRTAFDLTTIILADQLGRIVCIDRHTGQIRWRRLSTSDNLTSLTIGDGLVVIGGTSWGGTQVQHGVVTLLDVLTGEPLETQIQSQDLPVWLGFADSGLLVIVSNGKLTGFDPATGRTAWRRDLPRLVGARRSWIGGQVLIVSTQQGQVGSALVMDSQTGELVNQVPIRAVLGQTHTFQAVQADGRWQVLTPMQAVALNVSGRTRWSDALCAPIGHMLMQLIGDRYVCIVGRTGTQEVPVLPGPNAGGRLELQEALRAAAGRLSIQAGGYRLYLLDRQTGVITTDTPLASLPAPIDPAASVFLDDALLLGVGDQTLLIQSQNAAD